LATGEDGGTNEITCTGSVRAAAGARYQTCAIRLRLLNGGADILVLPRSGDRSHIGSLLQSVTHGHLLAARREQVQERVGNSAMQKNPACRRAPLAGVREAGGDGGFDGFTD